MTEVEDGDSNVVYALVKLENLKAIHNTFIIISKFTNVVYALVKLENLKAIHNGDLQPVICKLVVYALVKLENLKAIHNILRIVSFTVKLFML